MQPQSSESGSIHLSLVLIIRREESVEFEIKVDIRTWCHRERRVSFSSQSRIKVLKSLWQLGKEGRSRGFSSVSEYSKRRRELSSYQITRPPRHLSQKVRSGLLSANAGDIQTVFPSSHVLWPVTSPGPRITRAWQCDRQLWSWSGPDPVKGSEQYGNRP